MWKRNFLIIKQINVFYNILILLSKYFNLFRSHLLIVNSGTDNENLLDKTKNKLKLTEEEVIKGKIYYRNLVYLKMQKSYVIS